MRQSRGPSTAPRTSCRTSTTASSTSPKADVTPDYRITCIFVDKRYRKHGYAKVALAGALDQIAAQGGGVVEGYPHEIGEKKMSNSFVYNGTRTMYEQAGFEFVRSKGLKNTVMRRTIRPA